MADTDTDTIIIDETAEPGAVTGGQAADAAADLREGKDEAILPKGAVENPDGSVTLQLLHPRELRIASGQGQVRIESYTELTFHRLTGADLNAIRGTVAEHQSVVLFTRSTRLRAAVMRVLYEKLDAADVTRAGKVLDTFF